MGKPINSGLNGCSPTSSNCVIWQGDDIECLNLCKGDTISDVFFQLACLVCKIKDQLDIDTYDFTCFDIATCNLPTSFREFIQVLIDKICELETLINEGESGISVAEDIVSVASCFSAELGPTATVNTYIQAIGAKLCSLESTVQNQQTAIQQLVSRVNVLEGYH